jgi:hypothetical protein
MRSLIKVGALTLTALVTSAAFIGCSSSSKKNDETGSVGGKDNEGPAGSIGLSLQPVPGITINSVHVSITGGTGTGGPIPAVEKDLPTPGTAKNFSFGLPLPVATGYQLSLTAESAETGDNITCTGGFGPFNITANQNTNISLTLTCVDNTNGAVVGKVNVVTDACPTLDVDYAVATPHTADVGGSIAVFSLATDTNPALPITYQWSVASPIGTFAAPTAKDTTFNCAAAGVDVLVTVTASNGACDTALSTVISCTNVTCGDNVFDPAVEPCDNSDPDPADQNPLCLPNCTLAACGNGTVQPPVEECDPPVPGVCSATCQNITPVCGDGFINGTEQCDPTATPPLPPGTPAGSTCNPVGSPTQCTIAGPPVEAVCGNGVTEPPTESCDNAGGNNYAIANCGDIWGPALTPPGGSADDCNVIESPACQACVAASPPCATLNCESLTGNAAGGPAAGQPLANLCRELLDCIVDSNCAGGGDTFGGCYCGTATDCVSGANGACKAEVEAATEASDFVTVGSRFGDEAFASGKATGRVDCAVASSCAGTCGITP